MRALDALRSSVPAAAAATRKQELDNRQRALAVRGDQLNQNLAQLDTELTNMVMKAATPYIVQIENDRGCSVLSSKASFLSVNDPSLDITSDLITRMNAAAATQPNGR